MASRMISLRVPVSWDRVVPALDRAASASSPPLAVRERTNGFLHLDGPAGTSLYVLIHAESPRCTVVTLTARRTWRAGRIGRAGPHLERVLAGYRHAFERELAP